MKSSIYLLSAISILSLLLVAWLSIRVKPIDSYFVLGLICIFRAILFKSIKSTKSKWHFNIDPLFFAGTFLIAATGLGMGTGSAYWDNVTRCIAWSLSAELVVVAIIRDFIAIRKMT